MGVMEEGISGGFTGKVGNQIGYKLNGQNIIKSCPGPSNKKRTKNQLKNQLEMKVLTDFLTDLTPFTKKGFGHLAIGTVYNYYNLAVRFNKSQVITGTYPDLKIDCSKVMLSKGDLAQPVNTLVERTEEGLKFTWENLDKSFPGCEDQVMMMAYFPGLNKKVLRAGGARRILGEDFLPLNPKLSHEPLEAFISFVSDDRLQAADSLYLGSVQPLI